MNQLDIRMRQNVCRRLSAARRRQKYEPGFRRKAATLALARKAVKDDWHILHDTTNNEVPPYRLKSRKP